MKKLIALFLTLCLILLCAGCNAKDSDEAPISVMVLNGSTGFGMAKLMQDAPAEYNFSVETDASNITAALIQGSCDIAALPTNAAASLYGKTEGGIRCIALNTRGVLYLVTGEGETITSLSDLEGKTVYVPAQNPSLIFSALCKAAGVNVTIDESYAQPADLRSVLASGVVNLAVLPEPMVTVACSANASLTAALDLTDEWDKVFPAGSLVQGCLVARTEFIEEHPEAVERFLRAAEESVTFLAESPAEGAEAVAALELLPSAAVAEKALPRCNLCFVTGTELRTDLEQFLTILYDASGTGTLPDDNFYYSGK